MNGTYRGVEGNIVPFVAAAVSRTFTSILHYCAVILCSFIVSYMFYIMLDILLVYIGRYGPASVTYLTILDAVHRLNYGKNFCHHQRQKLYMDHHCICIHDIRLQQSSYSRPLHAYNTCKYSCIAIFK